MNVQLWVIGKTTEAYLRTGETLYLDRLKHYLPFQYETLAEPKAGGKLSPEQRKSREAATVMARLKPQDGLVLLDEKGLHFSSLELSTWLEKELQRPHQRLIFLVGGAFGFDPTLYARAFAQLSLGKMTFSHQMVRLFLLEQLYRSMTILRGEKYHNE